MSVTLVADNLTQPQGELDASLFPDGNLTDLLAGWLQDAKDRVDANTGIATADQNEAAAAWVYYRAYTQVAQRFANEANSITVGPRTESYNADQRKYFADQAQRWLDWFYAQSTLTPAVPVPAFFGTIKGPSNCYRSVY